MIFNWILINKLAIGTPLTSERDKIFLEDNKIKGILDLRNQFDLSKINFDYEELLDKKFKYINFGLPDHNSKRFATKDEIKDALDILEELLKNGPVYMHCHAAVERCPLISVAFLKKNKQLSLIQSYEYVKQQNNSTNILMGQLLNI